MYGKLPVIIAVVCAVMLNRDAKAFDFSEIQYLGNDAFCDSIEKMLPQIPGWVVDELHDLRKEADVPSYTYACFDCARKYYTTWIDPCWTVELKTDSIVRAGLRYTCLHNEWQSVLVPNLLYEQANSYYLRGRLAAARQLANIGVLLTLHQSADGALYGKLRALESMLDADSLPDTSRLTMLAILKAFEHEYEASPDERTHHDLSEHYMRTCELLVQQGELQQADSVYERAMDFLYSRNDPDVISGKTSVILPTSNLMIHTTAVAAELAMINNQRDKAIKRMNALLWRFYENWVLKQLPSYDFIDYFKAVQYLCEHGLIDDDNREPLLYSVSYIHDYMRGLAVKIDPKLRRRFFDLSRTTIYDVNSYMAANLDDEVLPALYNNIILYKGLDLQLSRSLNHALKENRLDLPVEGDYAPMSYVVSLISHTEDLEWEYSRKALVHSDFESWLQVDWQKVREALRPDDVAIEFFTTREGASATYWAAVIKPGWRSPKVVRLFDKNALAALDSRRYYTIADCSKLIWKPLLQYINAKGRVYFSPIENLHNIAVENLPTPDGKGYMCDKYDMRRLSSTKELVDIRHNDSVQSDSICAIFGQMAYSAVTDEQKVKHSEYRSALNDFILAKKFAPLGTSNRECEHIDSMFASNGWRTDLYIDGKANEGNFYAAVVNKPRVLHFSTHGFYFNEVDSVAMRKFSFLRGRHRYDDDQAMRQCGLVMSGADVIFSDSITTEPCDGILTAEEISRLDLTGTELVTLAACQTGLGTLKADGVYGLQRGFKQAGAQSLLLTLWDVSDDMSSILLQAFYDNYTRGMPAAQSLAKAKMLVRNFSGVINGHSYDGSNPQYWAGFILLDAKN